MEPMTMEEATDLALNMSAEEREKLLRFVSIFLFNPKLSQTALSMIQTRKPEVEDGCAE